MRDFKFLRTTWKSLLKFPPQNHKCQPPRKQKWKSFILPQQMQNKACFAEHGTPVCWPLCVAQSQNPNSHLINNVGPDHPFCIALQELVVFFQNGAKKVWKGFWVPPYWDSFPKQLTLRRYGRELEWTIQIWPPFQESWKYQLFVDIQ